MSRLSKNSLVTVSKFCKLHDINNILVYRRLNGTKYLKDGIVDLEKVYEDYNKKVDTINYAHDLYFKLSDYMSDKQLSRMLSMGSTIDEAGWFRYLNLNFFSIPQVKSLDFEIDDQMKEFISKAEAFIASLSYFSSL